MQNAFLFLVKTVIDLYLFTVILRLLLQWVRADFYNPISQFIVKVTNPLVVPLRRVVPPAGGIDTATVVVLIVLEFLATALLIYLAFGTGVPASQILSFTVLRLVVAVLQLYFFMILVYALLSWFTQAAYSPVASLLASLVNPVLRPFRRIIPLIGGLDLTPLVVLLLIQAVMIALPLPGLLR